MVKIQHCTGSNGFQIFLQKWFFMLTTIVASGIFSIHDIWKKIKKWPEPNIQKSLLSCPLTMQRNFWNMYCIFKLFCQSFKLLTLSHFWNFLPRIGAVTPEDISFPEMNVAGWISTFGFALTYIYLFQLQCKITALKSPGHASPVTI